MEYKQHPFKVFTISVNYFEGIVFCEKIYGVLRFISFYTFLSCNDVHETCE
ncbi:TPA: hypothetical protein KEO49_000803 [Staphylococcus aureus]|nr:hypothetical protein [Staphylococcus aureus]